MSAFATGIEEVLRISGHTQVESVVVFGSRDSAIGGPAVTFGQSCRFDQHTAGALASILRTTGWIYLRVEFGLSPIASEEPVKPCGIPICVPPREEYLSKLQCRLALQGVAEETIACRLPATLTAITAFLVLASRLRIQQRPSIPKRCRTAMDREGKCMTKV
jgi:hypothetical protein